MTQDHDHLAAASEGGGGGACAWTQEDDEGAWATDCGELFVLNDGECLDFARTIGTAAEVDKDLAAAPKQQLPEPVAWMHNGYVSKNKGRVLHDEQNNRSCGFKAQPVHALYTADQLRTAIAAERERVRLEHARELVEAHREAFVGNIEALSKLDLDAMNAQPLLMAVQNWDISTGRARELLRCWVLGTFKPDMLPECGDELFAEADEPRDAWAKLQAELSTLRQQLAEAGREWALRLSEGLGGCVRSEKE